MQKITTLFKKDPSNLALVINEINPGNEWVLNGEGIATRKFDGTACAIINGELYKRYDVKKRKAVPEGAIPCQDPDEITGHWPHWLKCDRSKKEDKYFWEGFDYFNGNIKDGTYELVGPKVQGNPEKFDQHVMLLHGAHQLDAPLTFDGLKSYLSDPFKDIEGIVFHGANGAMCKIRKSDFGIKRISL